MLDFDTACAGSGSDNTEDAVAVLKQIQNHKVSAFLVTGVTQWDHFKDVYIFSHSGPSRYSNNSPSQGSAIL